MKPKYISNRFIGRVVPREKADGLKGKANADVIREIKSRQPYY